MRYSPNSAWVSKFNLKDKLDYYFNKWIMGTKIILIVKNTQQLFLTKREKFSLIKILNLRSMVESIK